MKILNIILTIALPFALFISCDTKEADVKTVQLEITGMTCEIGCAKLIQSKLYKTDGVTFAEVHFADSSGVITYDANRLSEKDLVAVVQQAGGGDLYSVSSIDPVSEEALTEDSTESTD